VIFKYFSALVQICTSSYLLLLIVYHLLLKSIKKKEIDNPFKKLDYVVLPVNVSQYIEPI